MEENFEDVRHCLQGPHHDLYRAQMPRDFVPLVLALKEGDRIELSQLDAVIGRHSEADIRLGYTDVSRRHCRLSFRDGCWWAFDLSSLNGVFLNGERVLEAVLHDGDLLQVGPIQFTIQGSLCVRPHPHDGILKSIADNLPTPRQAG